MANRNMPADTSCRVEHGGCGREVVVIREQFVRRPFGQQLSNQTERLAAAHADEVPLNSQVVAHPTGDQFRRARMTLEFKCVAHHERLKEIDATAARIVLRSGQTFGKEDPSVAKTKSTTGIKGKTSTGKSTVGKGKTAASGKKPSGATGRSAVGAKRNKQTKT